MDEQNQTPQVDEVETPQEEPQVEEPVTEEAALENSKNPERTAEYIEKLKTERDDYRNLLESLRPEQQEAVRAENFPNLNQQQVDDVVQSLVDQDGYLDGSKLQNTLNDLNVRLRQAEERAKKAEAEAKRAEVTQRDFEEKQVMREVHAKYPTLDPHSEAFDQQFFDAVRNELFVQMMNGQQSPIAAADKWHGILYNKAMTKKEKDEQIKKEEAKRTINAVGTRSTIEKGYWEKEEDGMLRDQVRSGTKGALAELLRRRGQ